MRPVAPAAHALRAARAKLIERLLLWIEPADRGTGETTGFGFWTGRDVVTITVNDLWTGENVPRDYQGGGAIIPPMPSFRFGSGLDILPATVVLSVIHPGVFAAVRTYDARGARAQVHRLTIDPDTRATAGIERAFKGHVNLAPDRDGQVDLQIVPTTRSLTVTANRTKSDAFQRLRDGDRFRRYKNVANADVPWGVKGTAR